MGVQGAYFDLDFSGVLYHFTVKLLQRLLDSTNPYEVTGE